MKIYIKPPQLVPGWNAQRVWDTKGKRWLLHLSWGNEDLGRYQQGQQVSTPDRDRVKQALDLQLKKNAFFP